MLDFQNFPLEDNEFWDPIHLNYKGAKKFSLFFDSSLKRGLLDAPNPQSMIDEEIQKMIK